MKHALLLIAFSFSIFHLAFSQNIGIGTTTPNASAKLDVSATNKGFLPPRMTAAQRKAITGPAAGLIVFDTDASMLYLYDGNVWQPLSSSGGGNTLTPSQPAPPAAEIVPYKTMGSSVAMSDNYAIAGAPASDSGSMPSTGAVYVYKKNTGGSWQVIQKLNAADAQSNAGFGSSVAIAGSYIVIGAPFQTVSGNSFAGKVYVFSLSGNTWIQQASFTKFSGAAASDELGFSVAVSIGSVFGPAFIVSAPYDDGNAFNSGAAYAYRFSGGAWGYEQTIIPNTVGYDDNFGWDVDIDGDYFVAGTPGRDIPASSLTNCGAVYVYVYGGGNWIEQVRLDGTVTDGKLGIATAVKGNRIAAGNPFNYLAQFNSASVFIYKRTGSAWGITDFLTLNNAQGYDLSNVVGASLAFDSTNTLLVGVPGGILYPNNSFITYYKLPVVLVYKTNFYGYFYLDKIINDNEPVLSDNGSNLFGNSIGIKNGNYIIGIPFKAVNGLTRVGKLAFGYVD